MLNILTGRNNLLPDALVATLRDTDDDLNQLVVVPRQLTLETERMLLRALNKTGSFTLQVLSPERLCARIFEAAGQPDGVRLDDRGRVILVRETIRLARDRLTLYRGQERRRGFAQRCAAELERYRQAGLTPDTLHECAARQTGTARQKFDDLGEILKEYEALIAGRYQDGEVEFNEAIARAKNATFLENSRVWFYGFDMAPPTLHALMAAVAEKSRETFALMPIPGDRRASDLDAFRPVWRAAYRLREAAETRDVAVRFVPVTPAGGADAVEAHPPRRVPAIESLEECLFAYPMKTTACGAEGIRMAQLNNPQEECRFAAAFARHMAYERGWRWDDMLILCEDLDGYAAHLQAAFDAYQIPLFLASSRSAARHRLSEFLITAIRFIDKGFPQEEFLALASFDLLPVTTDEAEAFVNAAQTLGIRNARFFKPLTEPEHEALEPVRAAMLSPVAALRDALRQADGLEAQLRALYEFLETSGALERAERRVETLHRRGLWDLASEEAQVVNRIFGAFDQLKALMSPDKLQLSELGDMLTEALSASIIKGLPQSGDAVFAQRLDGACMRPVRLLMLLGLNDRPSAAGDGLLTEAQQQTLADFTRAYLGPDAADVTRIRRAQVKSALGMATDCVLLTNAGSGIDGAAQRPSALFQTIRALFPDAKAEGGVQRNGEIERLLDMSVTANLNTLARRVGEGVDALTDGEKASLNELGAVAKEDEETARGVALLRKALDRDKALDALSEKTARRLYEHMTLQSVSSLERFASCPFSYYLRYGIEPETLEPYSFDYANEGTFYHAAVETFLKESTEDVGALTAEEAEARMRRIARAELTQLMEGPLGDTALTKAEARRLEATACACGVALNEHMRSTGFRPRAMELRFGRPEDAAAAIELPDGGRLHGAIDRVDFYETDEGGFIRIVDYKRGGKALELYLSYYGLRLQLLCYLEAAERRFDAKPAGVYYFPVKEGIVRQQALDEETIEKERGKALSMDGYGGDEIETILEKQGRFDTLTRHALKRAGEHYRDIRSGVCAVSPARTHKDKMPCAYCDYRAACLFEEKLDFKRVRVFKKMKDEEALMLMENELE